MLRSFLFGVSGVDPLALTLAAVSLLLLTLAASLLLARRAATVDLTQTLRAEWFLQVRNRKSARSASPPRFQPALPSSTTHFCWRFPPATRARRTSGKAISAFHADARKPSLLRGSATGARKRHPNLPRFACADLRFAPPSPLRSEGREPSSCTCRLRWRGPGPRRVC
jgi:hypothetical protein